MWCVRTHPADWAEITPDADAELGLTIGSEVTCLLKAHSLRVAN